MRKDDDVRIAFFGHAQNGEILPSDNVHHHLIPPSYHTRLPYDCWVLSSFPSSFQLVCCQLLISQPLKLCDLALKAF